MSTVKKLAVFVVMVSAVIAAERAWLNAVQPQIATQVAIGQLQGNDNALRELRLFETYKGVAEVALVMIALAIAWWLVRQPRRSSRRDWPQLILISTMSIFAMTGCISFVRSAGVRRDRYIGNGIPYSIGRQHRHAGAISIGRISARIEGRGETRAITHRWSQEGRLPNSGRWIGTVRLIKVNRSPVTREWTAEATTGTAAKNQAI